MPKETYWRFEWTHVEPGDWAFALVFASDLIGVAFFRRGFAWKKHDRLGAGPGVLP